MKKVTCRPHVTPFPVKLHRMLAQVEREGKKHIVSWNPDGRTFQVHDHDKFVSEVLHHHFKQTKYKSFQRQLNFYAYKRITSGPLEGAYGHPFFIKGNEDACRNVKRHESQQLPPQQSMRPQDQQNFPNQDKCVAHLANSISSESENLPAFSDSIEIHTKAVDTISEQGSLWDDIMGSIVITEHHQDVNNSVMGDVGWDDTSHYLQKGAQPLSERTSFVGRKFYYLPSELSDM